MLKPVNLDLQMGYFPFTFWGYLLKRKFIGRIYFTILKEFLEVLEIKSNENTLKSRLNASCTSWYERITYSDQRISVHSYAHAGFPIGFKG